MANYLKALAVFRLVTEQADSSARGWWHGNAFCFESQFDESSLARFFLNDYRPTPIVAPWNGGSGFGEGEQREGIDAILASESGRLSEYRKAINSILLWPETGAGEMTLDKILADVQGTANALRPGKKRDALLKLVADFENAVSGINRESLLPLTTEQIKTSAKPVAKAVTKLRTAAKQSRRAGGKPEIVRACRNRLSDSAVDWIDSAIVLRKATELACPPILGTGGIEGHGEYTHWFMERISTLILGDQTISESLLRNALFQEHSSGFSKAPFGQLNPGRAGGYNQGANIESKALTNPWDFVLAMEGAVAWASGAGRRQGVRRFGVLCSPFTVRTRAVGYSSAEEDDESTSRAEVWLPVWTRACTFEELRTLLREGRSEWRGNPVDDAIQFAEAASSLGTDRGIDAFHRFSLINRRGKDYIALPLGRVPVREDRDTDLLAEVDPLLSRIDAFAGKFKGGVPASLKWRRRQLDLAIFEFALHGGKHRIQNILASLGRIEKYFAARDLKLEPGLESPLTGISLRWIDAANDGSINFRIAVAVASIRATGKVGGIRANLAPIDPEKPNSWADGLGQCSWQGNRLYERMTTLLKRRLMDADRLNIGDPVPLNAALKVAPHEVALFLEGTGVDESRIEDLLFGCALMDWSGRLPEKFAKTHDEDVVVPRSYALLKQLFHFRNTTKIRPEPAILSLLSAGRTKEACEVALRRLRISDYHPVIAEFPDEPDGVRLAASLLIPIHSMDSLSRLVLHQQEEAAR